MTSGSLSWLTGRWLADTRASSRRQRTPFLAVFGSCERPSAVSWLGVVDGRLKRCGGVKQRGQSRTPCKGGVEQQDAGDKGTRAVEK